jgi:hypothetical protein
LNSISVLLRMSQTSGSFSRVFSTPN